MFYWLEMLWEFQKIIHKFNLKNHSLFERQHNDLASSHSIK